MDKELLGKIIELCKSYQAIKLVYFFGSRVTGRAGPASDYDFAFYFDGVFDSKKLFLLKAELQAKLSLILKTDNVDIVVLNNLKNDVLGFQIIYNGKLIYEVEPFKVLIEPMILNRYYDFKIESNKYLKVKAKNE